MRELFALSEKLIEQTPVGYIRDCITVFGDRDPGKYPLRKYLATI